MLLRRPWWVTPPDQPRYRRLFSGPLLPLALSARVSLLGAGTAGTGLALDCVYVLRGVSEAWNSRRPLLVPCMAQSIGALYPRRHQDDQRGHEHIALKLREIRPPS